MIDKSIISNFNDSLQSIRKSDKKEISKDVEKFKRYFKSNGYD